MTNYIINNNTNILTFIEEKMAEGYTEEAAGLEWDVLNGTYEPEDENCE